MPSLSLSRYSVLCPLHGCSSSAPRQADPCRPRPDPTTPSPSALRPLRSLRDRDREIAVHFEQICKYRESNSSEEYLSISTSVSLDKSRR